MDDIYKNIEECNLNNKKKSWLYSMIWLVICLVTKTLIQ